ncbi:MAG: hypothetical protein ACRCXD_09925 [Luteolibacter sp.]
MSEPPTGSWSDSKGLARAILRDRGERRKWLGRMALVPLAMLGIGLWVLDGWIWVSPWRVIFWWGGCTLATLAVIFFALYDALAVVREEREKARFDVDPP